MNLKNLDAYELIKQENIEDIHAEGYLLKHKKSGARVLLLANDDDNKVFNIAFRTPPEDSTGVAHIIEHSVLCGSREFPLKDPFVELVKGSLNTFLNAMTYPDKTMYPVASCNEQDLKNLMHVYLDAVFYPNIYENPNIFRQEGWNYELEQEDGELKYNGVVYNEMKGAFSSAEEVLERTVFSTLFPDTPYGVESGGDPDNIPDLTYEQFLEFHRKYYHPSNSYIYLYGDMDMEERLQWMDANYLSKFDARPVASQISYQKSFEEPVEKTLNYPVAESEPEEDNSYLSWSAVVTDSVQVEQCVAFQVLDYALLSAPGAPLKQALLDANMGKDIFGGFSDGILQPFFTIVAKNANPENKEKFLSIIKDTLEQLSENGLDQKSLKAGINYLEFRFREADYASYPRGLMYGIDVFDSWLYDDKEPFAHLHQLAAFDSLKTKITQGYFEQLIKDCLLNNNHVAVVVTNPKKGLTNQREEQLKEKLQKYKETLNEQQIQTLIKNTKDLKDYQGAEESPEALATIPMLKRSDIKRETLTIHCAEKQVCGVKVLHHEMDTQGIGYMTVLFDLSKIPVEYTPYLSLLKSVLGYVNTEHYTYPQLFNEINANTGGVLCGLQVFNQKPGADRYQPYFGIKSKALYEKIDFVFAMMEEILCTSKVEDEKRLYEILAMQKSRAQTELVSAGHSTAVLRSTSYFSPLAAFQDQVGGLGYYRVIKDLEEHFQEKKTQVIGTLNQLRQVIFHPDNFMISFTGDATGFTKMEENLQKFVEALPKETKSLSGSLQETLEKKNEGIKTAAQVQYVAQTGNYVKEGFAYTGVLRILKMIMSYDYLWNHIRVEGGAYGCMTGFKRSGDAFFASYRDPKLAETFQVFAGVPEYLRNFTADEDEMTKYILGTVSGMDTPLNPAAKGALALTAYMNGVTQEDLQRERDQVLDATDEHIRQLADLIESVLKQENYCVVGSESAIEQNRQRFGVIDTL